MRRNSLPSVIPVLLLAWLGLTESAWAQPVDGDLIVASTGTKQGVFHTSKRVLGLQPLPGSTTLWVSAVAPAYGNTGLMVLTTLGGGALFHFPSSGAPTPIAILPAPAARDLILDQDGAWLLPATGRIYRVSGTQLTTWATSPGGWDAIDRDGDSGDFVITQVPQGQLMRVDRVTRQFTTIATNLGTLLTGVAYNPITGSYAVTRSNNRTGLVIVSRRSTSPKFVAITNAGAVAVHPWTGDYWVGTFDGRVIRVAPDGTVLSSTSYGAGYLIRDIAVYGSRNLSLSSTGLRGASSTIALRFNRSPSRSYCVALSLANRPGIGLPDGRTLMLAPDGLFFTTVCRDIAGITERFLGILGRGGTATATLTIPSSVPTGTRIHIGAAAVNPTLPSGLDISNVEVLQVR